MRAKLLSPMLLSMLFALGACTSEDFDTESAVESVCAGKGVGVNIVKSPFEGEDATRVNISYNPYPKYEAIWTEGDAIGVFTLGSDYSWKCKNEKEEDEKEGEKPKDIKMIASHTNKRGHHDLHSYDIKHNSEFNNEIMFMLVYPTHEIYLFCINIKQYYI